MRRLIVGLVVASVLVCTSAGNSAALADTIVDTGQPSMSTNNWSLHNNPITASTVWLYGKFSLDQPCILNDIQGFIHQIHSGSLTLAIYADGGTVPNLSEEIFSGTFQSQPSVDAEWDGLSGVNWSLPAGTYWLGFEPRLPDRYYGAMPDNAPQPLNGYAGYNPSLTPALREENSLNFGVRITGVIVPEPSTLVLLGIGAISLLAYTRRRRAA